MNSESQIYYRHVVLSKALGDKFFSRTSFLFLFQENIVRKFAHSFCILILPKVTDDTHEFDAYIGDEEQIKIQISFEEKLRDHYKSCFQSWPIHWSYGKAEVEFKMKFQNSLIVIRNINISQVEQINAHYSPPLLIYCGSETSYQVVALDQSFNLKATITVSEIPDTISSILGEEFSFFHPQPTGFMVALLKSAIERKIKRGEIKDEEIEELNSKVDAFEALLDSEINKLLSNNGSQEGNFTDI